MLTKNQLFEILLDWNYWNREFPSTIPRESYEKKIELLSQRGSAMWEIYAFNK